MESTTTIKTSLTFNTFSVIVVSLILFFLTLKEFSVINENFYIFFPTIIMDCTVVIAMFSMLSSRMIEKPLLQMQNDIERSLANNKENPLEEHFTITNLQRYSEIKNIETHIKTLILFVNKQSKDAAIGVLAKQVAHDIRSPVAAILMLAKEVQELPEEQRISLRDAANRIQDIANNLLHTSEKAQEKNTSNLIYPFLVSTAILSVISEKKLQYKDANIKIDYDFREEAIFSFINVNLIEFKRVISNLLNNAIEAIERNGEICVQLLSDTDLLEINIIDSGKGMPLEIRNKILNGDTISSKTGGLGLGFSHARDFLAVSDAKLAITRSDKEETVVSLMFKKSMTPTWIANEIGFFSNSVVVILDDDISIHGAWDSLFAKIIIEYPRLQISHFTQATQCIEYLQNLSPEIKKSVVLLADYELIKQNLNGLDVIELVQLNKAILVTSHYENRDILKRAALLNTKVLPKLLAPNIKLSLMTEDVSTNKVVDLVVLEDNKQYSDVLAYLCEFRGKSVDIYHEPYALFEKINQYDKSRVKICLDFDLNTLINGVEVASVLHHRGFENLFLASGHKNLAVEVPEYLCVLPDKIALLDL